MKNKKNHSAPPPNPGAEAERVRTARWGYGLGAGLCVFGLIVLSVALGTAIRTASRGLHRVAFPGEQTLELKEPGLYVAIYAQEKEGPLPAGELAGLEAALTDEAGMPVSVEKAPPGAAMARLGNRTGLVLFQFEAPGKGRYRLETAYSPGFQGPRGEGFLIHESLGHNRADLVAGVLLCAILGGMGIFLLVRTRQKLRIPETKRG